MRQNLKLNMTGLSQAQVTLDEFTSGPDPLDASLLVLLGYSRPGDIVTIETGSGIRYRFERVSESEE